MDFVKVWAKKGTGCCGRKGGILRGDDMKRTSSFLRGIVNQAASDRELKKMTELYVIFSGFTRKKKIIIKPSTAGNWSGPTKPCCQLF